MSNRITRQELVFAAQHAYGYPFWIVCEQPPPSLPGVSAATTGLSTPAPKRSSNVLIKDEQSAYAFIHYASDNGQYKARKTESGIGEETILQEATDTTPASIAIVNPKARAIAIPASEDTEWEENADPDETSQIGQDLLQIRQLKADEIDRLKTNQPISQSAIGSRFPVGAIITMDGLQFEVTGDAPIPTEVPLVGREQLYGQETQDFRNTAKETVVRGYESVYSSASQEDKPKVLEAIRKDFVGQEYLYDGDPKEIPGDIFVCDNVEYDEESGGLIVYLQNDVDDTIVIRLHTLIFNYYRIEEKAEPKAKVTKKAAKPPVKKTATRPATRSSRKSAPKKRKK